MNQELLSAIIGAAATLIVGVLTLPFAKNVFVRRHRSKMFIKNPSRINSLIGNWTGETVQTIGVNGENTKVKLSVEFKKKGNSVDGRSIIEWQSGKDQNKIVQQFEGGFIDQNFIKIQYSSLESDIVNFGVLILELKPDSKTLVGNILGYGHQIESTFSGSTKLKKDA